MSESRPIPTAFTRQVGIDVPLICGAMYPCSNPELIAAVSAAGGIGIVQPISMIYVHGHDLRDGLRKIRETTDRPIGFNAIVEKSVKAYEDRMRGWVDVALEEGVTAFDTSLGGLGGCPIMSGASGNIPTEDFVNLCQESDIATGTSLAGVRAASERLQQFLERSLPSRILQAGTRSELYEKNRLSAP